MLNFDVHIGLCSLLLCCGPGRGEVMVANAERKSPNSGAASECLSMASSHTPPPGVIQCMNASPPADLTQTTPTPPQMAHTPNAMPSPRTKGSITPAPSNEALAQEAQSVDTPNNSIQRCPAFPQLESMSSEPSLQVDTLSISIDSSSQTESDVVIETERRVTFIDESGVQELEKTCNQILAQRHERAATLAAMAALDKEPISSETDKRSDTESTEPDLGSQDFHRALDSAAEFLYGSLNYTDTDADKRGQNK